MNTTNERMILMVQGQVQGVGFRPFVWRLANEEKLAGFVRNTSGGVRIEVQGPARDVARFGRRLTSELPPLAKITKLEKFPAPLANDAKSFEIGESQGHAGQNVLVSPDVAVCADCLADIREPGNPRYNYAFANCTNCGPRFSITKAIPYDRRSTTMGCFELCPLCKREYTDPANRRFHAQPIACPVCGPKIWFVAREDAKRQATLPDAENCRGAIAKTGALLLSGGIVAIRGLGGFQLACNARSSAAVTELRKRKQRPHKALAVMARDLETVKRFCEIAPGHERLLAGNRKPITLCPLKPDAPLAPELAPDTLNLGVMLPYTPLHALLLDWLAANGPNEPILVMTSANPQGEPITLGNREALARLARLADAWLLHDRDILCRVDDSVAAVQDCGPLFLRRARGYVPEPVQIGIDGPTVLGTGGLLKATFCLTRGKEAFLGQHIGDLDSPANMGFYEESLAHLQKLLEVKPAAVVHDLHPDFASTHFARALAGKRNIPAIPLQHHAAHAVACLADNNCYEPALALCLDGSGLGTDGAIWGGELLHVDLARAEWRRLGSLAPFPLPGGEAAIREPWRIATALAWRSGTEIAQKDINEPARSAVLEMLKLNVNCPLTTSCGRLFDGAASLSGLCRQITYEGQAAMRLEKAAQLWLRKHKETESPRFEQIDLKETDGLWQLDGSAIFAEAFQMLATGENVGAIAYAFHDALARGFADMAKAASLKTGVEKVALSGGVMQNSIMARLLPRRLRGAGLEPLAHRQTPPGDGGISLGQAVWGASALGRFFC